MARHGWFHFAFFVLVILWLAACTPTATEPIPTGRPSTIEPPPSTPEATIPLATPKATTITQADLQGTTWQLLTYGPADNPTAARWNMPITAAFDGMGKLYGSTRCTNYWTEIAIQDNGDIAIDPVLQSDPTCPTGELLAQEAAYIAALESAAAISLHENALAITYADGILTYESVPTLTPSPLDGTNWRLLYVAHDDDYRVETIINTLVLLAFDDGQVDLFAGCNAYLGSYHQVGSSFFAVLHPPQRERSCPAPGAPLQEQQLVDALHFATSAGRYGTELFMTGEFYPEPRFEATLPLSGPPFTTATWRLAEIDLATGQTPLPVTNLTIEFREDGSFGGWTGCNDYGGRYTAIRASLILTDIESTEMGCYDEETIDDQPLFPTEGEAIILQETTFLNNLRTVHHAAVDRHHLYIIHNNGIMRFVRE
jgi:heat shock protein HslJ